jgi:outer membrane protein OmpA-like peptidoglycan-associated protein
LVTVLYLLGGVLDSSVPEARGDWELLGASRAPGQSDTLSLRAQGQVQKQDPESAGSKSSSGVSQPKSGGIGKPPFLKHAVLFDPDGAELSAESRNAVKRAASWLREHRRARILIVGFCDSSGSETCTPALAERRGAVVRRYLVRLGAAPDQIAAVKGWSAVDRECRTDAAKCQQVNRSAAIFIASSATPLN